jgi:hypothetical protein
MSGAATLDELGARFGVPCWWGPYTRAYWALVPASGRWRLVEALSLRELAMAIQSPDGWPWP